MLDPLTRQTTGPAQGNGNLQVGKAYTTLLGLRPGDELDIKLGSKQIPLVPAGSSHDED